jgi:hypothetical protein
MKKLFFIALFSFFASATFAQNKTKPNKGIKDKDISFSSDIVMLNPAYLTMPTEKLEKKAKKNKKSSLNIQMSTKANKMLTSSYILADGSTFTWIFLFDQTSKKATTLGLDNNKTSSDNFVSKELPANFWEKAEQSLLKGDETNQKLSIEAILKQVYN